MDVFGPFKKGCKTFTLRESDRPLMTKAKTVPGYGLDRDDQDWDDVVVGRRREGGGKDCESRNAWNHRTSRCSTTRNLVEAHHGAPPG